MDDSSVNVGRMEVKDILLDKLISSLKEVESIVCTVAKKEKCSSELGGVRTHYAMKEIILNGLKSIFLFMFSHPLYLLCIFTI